MCRIFRNPHFFLSFRISALVITDTPSLRTFQRLHITTTLISNGSLRDVIRGVLRFHSTITASKSGPKHSRQRCTRADLSSAPRSSLGTPRDIPAGCSEQTQGPVSEYLAALNQQDAGAGREWRAKWGREGGQEGGRTTGRRRITASIISSSASTSGSITSPLDPHILREAAEEWPFQHAGECRWRFSCCKFIWNVIHWLLLRLTLLQFPLDTIKTHVQT